MTPSRRIRVALLVLLITLGGAALRFYGLGHGAPYHFHADEMHALRGAELLRASPHLAALSAKFFVYPVLPKKLLGLVVTAYEALDHPLDLATERDSETLMRLGRLLSAAASTATIPVVFVIGRRLGGDVAGMLAAVLSAGAVVNIANAHFYTQDAMLTFGCAVTLLAIVRVAQDGGVGSSVLAGAGLGAALACKYTAGFLVLPLVTAHFLSPSRPRRPANLRAWLRWFALGVQPLVIGGAIFLAVNPLILAYPQKFAQDVTESIIEVNFQRGGPVWTAQFADVAVRPYWFTNLLPWNLGPAFAAWGLAGIGWLLYRRDRASIATASYAIFFYLVASQTTTPYARYLVPAVPALAVGASVLSRDLLHRSGASRKLGLVATLLVVGGTWFWGLAYMNVYRRPDARIQAARFIDRTIAEGARILVEPSHNTPPMGTYLDEPQIFNDYVGWGPHTVRRDRYVVHTLDVYRHLYDGPLSPEAKRQYIRDRLALVDYIVMDDTFDEFYQHLQAPEHAPVREYYRDLFAGRLGFRRMRDFEVNPSLFGFDIQDDAAEMTFSLFDHPDIHLFERTQPK
jgi:hypothetical protein